METKARATASVVARELVGVTVMLGLAVGSAAVAERIRSCKNTSREPVSVNW
jgi:hypothetical protein